MILVNFAPEGWQSRTELPTCQPRVTQVMKVDVAFFLEKHSHHLLELAFETFLRYLLAFKMRKLQVIFKNYNFLKNVLYLKNWEESET